MECTTAKLVSTPLGRDPKFGEGQCRARDHQPPLHSDGASDLATIGIAVKGIDTRHHVQARHAIAHLSQ